MDENIFSEQQEIKSVPDTEKTPDNNVNVKKLTIILCVVCALVGGILGGGGVGASITYCSFTGVNAKATGGEGRMNGIVGDIWSKNYKMAECFSVGYNTYRGSYLPTYLGPVYGTTKQNGITQVTVEAIYGEGAKSAMPGLSWGTAWKVSTGYPKVQIITPEMDYKF